MKFIATCSKCGAKDPIDNDGMSCIQIYFHKGSTNIQDRFVIYCERCGNKNEYAITQSLSESSIRIFPVEP